MTREQKLALIVGFSLVLVVGVLISDHWSRAATQELAQVTPEEMTPLIPAALTPAPRIDPPPEPAISQAREEEAAPDGAGGEILDDAVRGRAAEQGGPAPAGPFHIRNGESVDERLREIIDPDNSGQRVAATEANVPVLRPDSGRTAARGGDETVLFHPVAKGETLFQIAKRYYGDGNLWRRIQQANADAVGQDGAVRQGVTLRIPSVDGAPVRPTPRHADPIRTAGTPARAVATYTVKSNDTLSEIAQRLLGSVKRMPDLIRANSDKIRDADEIRAGMVLKVPSA